VLRIIRIIRLIRIVKLYKNAVLARENRDQKLKEKERQASIERKLKEKELEDQKREDDTATVITNVDGGATSSPMS
jgi:hypothetical protein